MVLRQGRASRFPFQDSGLIDDWSLGLGLLTAFLLVAVDAGRPKARQGFTWVFLPKTLAWMDGLSMGLGARLGRGLLYQDPDIGGRLNTGPWFRSRHSISWSIDAGWPETWARLALRFPSLGSGLDG